MNITNVSSSGGNMTINHFVEMRAVINFLDTFEPYYIILIVTIGLVGNSISFLMFAFTKLRFKDVHINLAVLALVDNGFLFVLLSVTLKHFNIDLETKYELVGCKLRVFLSYVFGFLSIWLIVLFSVERFIAVFFPLKRHTLCNLKRNVCLIVLLVCFAILFYSYSFWTSELDYVDKEANSGLKECVTIEKWLHFFQLMAIIDMQLTMLVPFVFILTLNILIIVRLSTSNTFLAINRSDDCNDTISTSTATQTRNDSSLKKQRQQQPKQKQQKQQRERNSSLYFVVGGDEYTTTRQNRNRLFKLRRYSKTTRTLLIISTMFLFLHGPTALVKLWFIFYHRINAKSSSSSSSSDVEHLIERVTCYIYYLHYSLNFFLYVLNLKKFREYFLNTFSTKTKAQTNNH